MVTKKELLRKWKAGYGENFSENYSGVLRKLPKTFSTRTLGKKWKDAYGESFSSNYQGVYRQLLKNKLKRRAK